ncbi:MAG: hypothetical protein JRN39_03620 [Nitrososphaerota archaeon]|nr:hypothetical protein [Nitrososphaerota archaeon]MDG6939472.1 hypothetical protein [Nitrososphaerota archaeon]
MIRGFAELKEGGTTLVVPKQSAESMGPATEPAFFNPRGRTVRDLAVLAFSAYCDGKPPGRMLDPLAGVGSKALRALVEGKGVDEAWVNDLNPSSMKAAALAARTNGVSSMLRTSVMEAHSFLESAAKKGSRSDIIDIDPFGSPTGYVEPALRALKDGGLISVTATDTAPLNGLYRNVSFRKYFGFGLRTDYSREVGLRLLCGMVVRRAMSLDSVARPVFVHSDQHYMRAYLLFERSAGAANAAVAEFGYISHCFSCGHRESGGEPKPRCAGCGSRMHAAGPLWLGRVFESGLVKGMARHALTPWLARHGKLLALCASEKVHVPYYFRLPDIADGMGVPSGSPARVAESLRETGFSAEVCPLDPQGVRTDAGIVEVKRALGPA